MNALRHRDGRPEHVHGVSAPSVGGGLWNADKATLAEHDRRRPPAAATSAGLAIRGARNLVEDGTDRGTLSGTLIGDPKLGPLADNGGPTKTHALLAGSPAFNAAADLLRRRRRPTAAPASPGIGGGVVDIGAFEDSSLPPTAVPDAAITLANQAVVIAVLANDTDPDGDPLTVTAVTQPSHGSATLTAGGQVIYAPPQLQRAR